MNLVWFFQGSECLSKIRVFQERFGGSKKIQERLLVLAFSFLRLGNTVNSCQRDRKKDIFVQYMISSINWFYWWRAFFVGKEQMINLKCNESSIKDLLKGLNT